MEVGSTTRTKNTISRSGSKSIEREERREGVRNFAYTQVVVLARIDTGFLISTGHPKLNVAEIMLEMRLKLQFIRIIFRRELRVDHAHIIRLIEVGICIWAVKTVQTKVGRNTIYSQKLRRTQRTRERRVRVGLVEITTRIQAAKHASGVALALLLLDTHAIVIFLKVISHEVNGRVRSRFEAQRAANCIHLAVIDIVAIEKVFCVAIALQIEAGHTRTDSFANRQIDHALGFHAVEVAVFKFCASREAG